MMIPVVRYLETLSSFLEKVEITDRDGNKLDNDDAFSKIIRHFDDVQSANKKVMVIGNGGSAAIASHFQNDLCKAVKVRAMVFTETPLLTALSNDISYTAAYREQVDLWTDQGDILFAISSSGRSQNIIDAVKMGEIRGCNPIITMSGFNHDNPLRSLGNLNLYIPSEDYGYVELAHSVLAHYISDQLIKTK